MSTPVLKPLLKPLLILLGTASMIFFGGIIALSLPESGLNAKDTAENLINRVNGLDGVNSPDSPSNTDQPANLATSQTNIVPASTATTITAQQAMAVASQYLPNDNLQAPIELVNYNGSAAYEVPLSSGPVYVDAWSAQLQNPPATPVVNGTQYEREDDEYTNGIAPKRDITNQDEIVNKNACRIPSLISFFLNEKYKIIPIKNVIKLE